MRRIENITYVTRDAIELQLDMALPEGDGPYPAVIHVHGGGWAFGERATTWIDWLAANGFAAITISYRFTDIACFPAQIHDVKAAIRWVRGHAAEYGIDPEHIGLWGVSAGGHLSALAACTNGDPLFDGDGNNDYSSDVQCAVPICPPTEFLINWYAVSELPDNEEGLALSEAFFGGGIVTTEELRRQASPLWKVGPDAVPQLIIHGEQDDLVPVSEVRAYAAALREHSVEHELIVDPVLGHDVHIRVDAEEGEPESLRPQILAFFRKHLCPA
ncbi:MAG: alpha/beta hydrolase [Thermomicrobiales bacterium]|nr:alpha/beta hydrolase [Thermomicrobiales bacterium]